MIYSRLICENCQESIQPREIKNRGIDGCISSGELTIFLVKLKATNKNSQTQTQIVWWLPEGKGVGEVEEGEGGQIYGKGRIDFGWSTHNAVYR